MYWCWFEKGDKRTTTKPGTDEEQKLQLWHSHQSIQVQLQWQWQRQITVYLCANTNTKTKTKHTCAVTWSHIFRTSSSDLIHIFAGPPPPPPPQPFWGSGSLSMWFDDKILVECSETTHNHIRPAHWMIPLWSHSITLQLDIVVCHLYLDQVREMVDSSHQHEHIWSDTWTQLEISVNMRIKLTLSIANSRGDIVDKRIEG